MGPFLPPLHSQLLVERSLVVVTLDELLAARAPARDVVQSHGRRGVDLQLRLILIDSLDNAILVE